LKFGRVTPDEGSDPTKFPLKNEFCVSLIDKYPSLFRINILIGKL
jgi:hypothetical protein